jgi:UDP-N-acetylglucosamine 2-epimerase (non-hydrolysing)/UDP-GlcNAc3NAcA epimerase
MPRTDIALCYGTRPQVIKASVLRRELARVGPLLAIDTGQHYDYELNALLYEQLGVRLPDIALEVGSASHGEQTGAILVGAEVVLKEHRPSAVVVIGDTNSTLGCALAAGKLRIPVVHVEAGLRSNDALMPEEINRRVVDSFASVLCTPSARATARVQAERGDAVVHETGDVAYDVLCTHSSALPRPEEVVSSITGQPYCFATLHRAELTDRPALLSEVLNALAALDQMVILALHPRTRAVLDAHAPRADFGGRLKILPPVGYLESLALTREAAAVVTDSGGLQREAYWLGVPCVTLRRETEWLETVQLGANVTVDPTHASAELGPAVRRQLERWAAGRTWDRGMYGHGDAASRVADTVETLLSS